MKTTLHTHPEHHAIVSIEGDGTVEVLNDGTIKDGQKPPYQELIGALRAIAMLGGNLSDDRLTDRTGPNDAAMRGLIYTQARKYAADMLIKAGYRLNDTGTEWVKDA